MDEMSSVGIRKNAREMLKVPSHLDEQPAMITMRMDIAISNLRCVCVGGGLPRRYKALGMPSWMLIQGEATHV